MPVKIMVYSKENCPGCRQTKMFLSRNNIKYIEINLVDANGELYNEEDQSLLDSFIEKGFQQFPVVEVMNESGSEMWSGFRPDKLNKLVKKA